MLPAFYANLLSRLREELSAMREKPRLCTHKVTDYCGRGTIWLPPMDYRRRKYADLKTLAAGHNVRLHLCGCKNKDLTNECCHPLPFQ